MFLLLIACLREGSGILGLSETRWVLVCYHTFIVLLEEY